MEAGDSSEAWCLYTIPRGVMFQKPAIYSYLYCYMIANIYYFNACFLCYWRSQLVKYHNFMLDAILIQFTRRWHCRVSFILPGIYAFADQWISLMSVGAALWWTNRSIFYGLCRSVTLTFAWSIPLENLSYYIDAILASCLLSVLNYV
jgi:hypothetical protein